MKGGGGRERREMNEGGRREEGGLELSILPQPLLELMKVNVSFVKPCDLWCDPPLSCTGREYARH